MHVVSSLACITQIPTSGFAELPIRYADFGVLHRNEFSGALTGLTRVRRFQQDDAHIFCRQDQIREEVMGVLDFMKTTYQIFGFKFELHLSTRPKKALGSIELWDRAEKMMTDALNSFGEPWKINPGDGAFYGPKIDIKVFDALGRPHQCATIQLDFQLPLRFGLRYRTAHSHEHDAAADDTIEFHGEHAAAGSSAAGHGKAAAPRNAVEAAIARVQGDLTDDLPEGFERPVIIHRAILGSVERMLAVLIEHTAGKWPFWISPRQVCVVPLDPKYFAYAKSVGDRFQAAGLEVHTDLSSNTYNKKIREAQVAQYNFILVVGDKEVAADSVNVRTRSNEVLGMKPVAEVVANFLELLRKFE
jgi:threonyl-tRNA synthetase